MKAKTSFIGLNARNVLGHVGRLGEDIAAGLFRGERVADNPRDYPFADVINESAGLALQVKMCNGRHAQRPLPKQVRELFDETQNAFLFEHGVYVFVFYKGVDENHRRQKGKSMIWSRKFSRATRREIIARELQYVYVVDVSLLNFMADKPEFIKERALVFDPETKQCRFRVLYLNRTLFKGFIERRESALKLLNDAIGQNKWTIKSEELYPTFTGTARGHFGRKIPIHIIGSRSTVALAARTLNQRPRIAINDEEQIALQKAA